MKANNTKTTATVNQFGQTVVTHPDAPLATVKISNNGGTGTFGAFAEVADVAMGAFSGKSYKTLGGARKAADKWLTERAARLAEDKAHAAAHPYTPPTEAERPAWLAESDRIAEEGYVVVHNIDTNGKTIGVTRGARLF